MPAGATSSRPEGPEGRGDRRGARADAGSASDWPIRRQRRDRRRLRHQLDAGREAASATRSRRGAQARGVEVSDQRGLPGDARFRPRADDDPRLPDARPSARQPRSARPRAAAATTRSCIRRATASPRPTTTARSSSTTCSAWNSRPSARCWRSCAAPIAPRSAWSSCTSPTRTRRPGSRSASRGRTRGSPSPPEGKRAILNKLVEAEGFEKFIDVKYTGTKRFGLDGSEVAHPGARADHQARRRARRARDRARHGASRPAERARPGDGQAAPRHLPRVQGRLLRARRRGGLGRREIPPRRLVRPRVRRQQGAPVADRQPVASRDRRSGRARQGARQAGPAAGQGALAGAAAAAARRRGLRRARASWRSASASPACAATAPAARCTSSSTTRSASPPIRATRAPRPIPPTWRR